MPTKKKKNSVAWRNSKEKDILYTDIDEGNIAGMGPKEVYETRGGIYKRFKYENFRGNLNRLRKTIAAEHTKADLAQEAYDHDKDYYKKPTNIFVWRGSDEQKQLRTDIKEKYIEEDVPPMEARLTRPMYASLPITTTAWRNYLWQERRRHFSNLDPEEKKKIIEMKNSKLFN